MRLKSFTKMANDNEQTRNDVNKPEEKFESGLVEKGATVKRKNKKLFIAYLYWLLGGIAGLHHFYLGRINQGFAYWTTGGGFVVAFIRDLWKIPSYVKQANLDPKFVKSFILERKQYRQPEFRGTRFLGMLSCAMFYGYLAQFAIPENCFGLNMNEHRYVWILVVPCSVAFGNYLVGNIGYETVSLYWASLGGFAPSLFLPLNPDMTSYCALFSTVLSYWKRSFRKTVIPKDASLLKLIAVIFGILLYSALWGSMLYYNVSVVTKEGERLYLRDIVAEYFDREPLSPKQRQQFSYWQVFQEMKADLYKFLSEMRTQVNGFRVMEDTQSYMILGLEWGATDEQITARYRELAKKYHPDKHGGEKDQDKIAEFNSRMVDITRAYEALTKKRKRKVKKTVIKPQTAGSEGQDDMRRATETEFDILKDEL
ncbi:dnaJ homolog subfamily C member 22-like [Convolutriloba macropyga]|uniref:dnaJ homolog subfamily C member 22-like n=1 Tax=Convolutriloba macropyga TaxID=536237 RepID=UPI003F51C3CE